MAVKVNKEKCNGCGMCKDVCPIDVINIEDTKAVISDGCLECGACIGQCPNGAISI